MKPTELVCCGQKERALWADADTGSTGIGATTLRAANLNTSITWSLGTENHSTISSTVAPASRFSNTAETGIRVLRNTHAPLKRSGTLSAAGHWDQSRAAMFLPLCYLKSTHGRKQRTSIGEVGTGSRPQSASPHRRSHAPLPAALRVLLQPSGISGDERRTIDGRVDQCLPAVRKTWHAACALYRR